MLSGLYIGQYCCAILLPDNVCLIRSVQVFRARARIVPLVLYRMTDECGRI